MGCASVYPLESSPQFVGPITPSLQAAVERALTEATARLDREKCAGIFRHYRDADGKPLSANLTERRLTARAFLQAIRFADGEHQRACENSDVLAFTHPRTDIVYLCGTRFALLAHSNPRLGAALLLHEELHVLGLGENPPPSHEITMRVLAACSAAAQAAGEIRPDGSRRAHGCGPFPASDGLE
ncbi:MAG TPA: hypothetical protein VKE50_11585 [Thermoanaerobaculia bacterium]|nr:hypothetical protein [Thermoanaerobaculia bacterium]